MGIVRNRLTFPDLSERTQLAMVIVHFFRQFQKDTSQTVLDDVLYSAQEPSESVEAWGDRLDRMVMKIVRFGLDISFDEYLEQWSTGTRDGAFSTNLDEALATDDSNKYPVVYDYASFKVWYNRYLATTRDKKKKVQRRSILLAIHSMRKKAGSSIPKVKKKSDKQTSSDKITSARFFEERVSAPQIKTRTLRCSDRRKYLSPSVRKLFQLWKQGTSSEGL